MMDITREVNNKEEISSRSGKPKKNPRDPQYVLNKRRLHDEESFQEIMLIGLLNEVCGFTITRPKKQSIVTTNIPILNTLHFEKEEFDIENIVDEHYREEYNRDKEREQFNQTAFRRFEKNKRNFLQSLLIDICIEKGFFFESKFARHSKKVMSIERIQRVYYNGTFLYEIEEIYNKGKAINSYLMGLLSNKHFIRIERNDPVIKSLL